MGTLIFLRADDEIRRQLEEVSAVDDRFGFDESFEVFIRPVTAEEIRKLVTQGLRIGGVYSQEYVVYGGIQTRLLEEVYNGSRFVPAIAPAEFKSLSFSIISKQQSLESMRGMIHWMVEEMLKSVDDSRADSFYDRHRGLI